MKSAGLLYGQKPLFGFDIGHGSIKVVRLDLHGKKYRLEGYGMTHFNPAAVQNGVITNFELVASATLKLFREDIVGNLGTRTAAVSLPVSHSFSRVISLPVMPSKDVLDAVKLEAEQYIPVPIDDLYIDFQVISSNKEGNDYLIAAAPKRVVDSYYSLFEIVGLEPVVMEPSTLSVTRMVRMTETSDIPTLIIDCGSVTTDLIIYNKESVRVTGTIKFGGNALTNSLAENLKLSESQANTIKSRYGLNAGRKQVEISVALKNPLENLLLEIKKIIRYFEDRAKDNQEKVEQVILLGGGANLPGLSTFLTENLRIPARLSKVWKNIDMNNLQRPAHGIDNSIYATATGLAFIKPSEVIA